MKKFLPIFIILLLLVSCDPGEHTCNFSSWHTLEPVTCTAKGTEYRTCECGSTETRVTDMLPHLLVKFEAKPATCTEPGFAAFEYCELCSYTTFTGELPPTHDVATVPAKSPTCTEVGHEAYEYCKRCENYNTYREIPATGHRFQGLECENCTAKLTAVAIPNSTVTVTDTITAAYYVTSDGLSLLTLSGTGATPDFDTSPFADLAPTHVYIGEGITKIGKNTFSGMTSLLSVTLASTVTEIGDGAFANCYRITEVINKSALPISYDAAHGEIGRYASAISADAVTRVKFIGDFAFYIDENNYTLVSYLGSSEHLTLPTLDGIDTYVVRDYAFFDLDFLLSVEYGEYVIHVGAYAFAGCDNLT